MKAYNIRNSMSIGRNYHKNVIKPFQKRHWLFFPYKTLRCALVFIVPTFDSFTLWLRGEVKAQEFPCFVCVYGLFQKSAKDCRQKYH